MTLDEQLARVAGQEGFTVPGYGRAPRRGGHGLVRSWNPHHEGVPMPLSIDHLVGAVEAARTALPQEISDLRVDHGAFKPSPGEWSVAETLEHLFLAELGGITRIWAGLAD